MELLATHCCFFKPCISHCRTPQFKCFALPFRLHSLVTLLANQCSSDFDWVSYLRQKIVESSRLAESCALCLIIRAIVVKSDGEENSWETIEVNVECWDVLMWNLKCLLLLGSLPSKDRTKWPIGISLRKVLEEGTGYYRAELARLVTVFFSNCFQIIFGI